MLSAMFYFLFINLWSLPLLCSLLRPFNWAAPFCLNALSLFCFHQLWDSFCLWLAYLSSFFSIVSPLVNALRFSLPYMCFALFTSTSLSSLFYFWNTNCILLLAYLSTLRFIVFSYDVIHSFGLYSFGIKMDCIPGKFNVTSTIRTLIKGEHRGLCYELCGYGHSTMLISSRTL